VIFAVFLFTIVLCFMWERSRKEPTFFSAAQLDGCASPRRHRRHPLLCCAFRRHFIFRQRPPTRRAPLPKPPCAATMNSRVKLDFDKISGAKPLKKKDNDAA
jgi:hypothetical protein